MLTVLDGDPGLGKSTVLLDIAARLSRGVAMPGEGECSEASGTVILTAEDDLATVVRPRLEAARADLSRVAVVRLMDGDQGHERDATFSPDDLEHVELRVREIGARLVIVDPLMHYLPERVDAHRDQDVRRGLAGLRSLAEQTGAAVVLVRHLNKSAGGVALYRGGGSIGIIALVRSGLVLAKDPDVADGTARVLAANKSNLGPLPHSLNLRLVSDGERMPPRVEWGEASRHTAEALLTLPETPEERGAIEEARDFLTKLLSAGPVTAEMGDREASAVGISRRTLARARRDLGVTASKVGGPGDAKQHWRWELPHVRRSVSKSANEGADGFLREVRFADSDSPMAPDEGCRPSGEGNLCEPGMAKPRGPSELGEERRDSRAWPPSVQGTRDAGGLDD
jgi:hypothetical protein